MGIFSDVLLTVDYDRTLTAPDSSIPERNLEAIRYFMENGGAFTVNTGRSVPMAKAFRNRVPMNAPLLLYNGSAAYDLETERLLFCHEIPLNLWQVVGECMALFPDLSVEMQGLRAHYRFREDPAWDAFCDYNGCIHAYARPGDDLGPFLKFSIYGPIRDVTVADLYNATAQELRRIDELESILRQRYGAVCQVVRAAPKIVDVQVLGASKGRSARELKAQLNRKILVCAGDADNDISMLEDADWGFCPADGAVAGRFPNVCRCADGAVADVIYEKIPEILRKNA